jgi:PAS domain S-box-containing protein
MGAIAGDPMFSKVRVETVCDRSSWFGARPLRAYVWVTILGISLCLISSVAAAVEQNAKNVLVLYSFTDDSIFGSVGLLASSLRARVPGPVDLYVEHLETLRFEDIDYEKSVVETLRHEYSARKLDLLIVAAYPALQFALRHRDELFPGVPIVFFAIEARRLAGQKMWPGVTGATDTVDLRATFDVALRLHPNTNTVAIITSNSAFDKYWLGVIHANLQHDHTEVKEIDLVGLPADQLFEKIAGLPPRSVVLFGLDPKESIQPAVGAWEILRRIGQRLPTYCAVPPNCLDHGGVGGVFYDVQEQTSLAAQLASRVLSGERPEDIPIVKGSPDRFFGNWRELRRWHIPESALPPGSVVLYREPTFWERDRKYILPAIVLIVAQALLIIGFLWQRARKRKAEAVLGESERRFRVMADTTPSLVWMCDSHGKITYLNERRTSFTGTAPNAEYSETWVAYVHTDDLENVLNTFAEALNTRRPFSMEYRLRRKDGVYRWMFDVASPRVNGDGSFVGFIASAVDTTDQKIAQQALEKMSGQLIEAQEKERTRIARELHDDICQRLALLSVELEQAERSSNESPTASKKRLKEIRKHCSEIAGDVQSMSHQLHSSKLDLLGIVAAIRGFCKEFSNQNEVSVEFTENNVPGYLQKEISLCLFRVVQEALHNAVKYSGVIQFTVELTGIENEIQLLVKDAGAGFDVEEAKKNRGLGLLSMQERIHIVHGRFSVNSKPGQGTEILAAVPVVVENRWVPDRTQTMDEIPHG